MMTELAVTMFGALIAMLGTNIGLWLKLNGVRQSTRGEIERLKVEISERSDTRAAESADRWLESYVAANLQWQTYAQQLILSQQAAGDRQVAELTEGVRQARSDLQVATRDAKTAAAKAEEIASQNVAEIFALQEQVKELRQDILVLQEQNKVLTEQNQKLIERKDISPAEVESLSAEREASKSDTIEENQNVA